MVYWYRVKVFIVLVIITTLLALYFSESDQDRLARAYHYNDYLFCGLVINHDMKLRCTAVLTANYLPCDRIGDDYQAQLCYYAVAMKKRGPHEVDTMDANYKKWCYDSIPLRMENGPPWEKELNYSVENYRKGCDYEALFLKNVSHEYMAYRTNNLSMCYLSTGNGYCEWVLTHNVTAACRAYSTFVDDCAGMVDRNISNCKRIDDGCYSSVAYLMGDEGICEMVQDKALRNRCYISVVELPNELRRCC